MSTIRKCASMADKAKSTLHTLKKDEAVDA